MAAFEAQKLEFKVSNLCVEQANPNGMPSARPCSHDLFAAVLIGITYLQETENENHRH